MPTTIVVKIVAMTEIGIATVTTETGIAVTVPNLLPAVATMRNDERGPHLQEGIMMTADLQGTMITGVAVMMIADHLIIMMIVVGMKTEDAMIENATTKKNVLKKGVQDLLMAMGGVEDYFVQNPFLGTEDRWSAFFQIAFASYFGLHQIVVVVVLLSSFTRTVYFSKWLAIAPGVATHSLWIPKYPSHTGY